MTFLFLYLFQDLSSLVDRPELTIGVVTDGSSREFQDSYLKVCEEEIRRLLGRDYNVQFGEKHLLQGLFQLDLIKKNLDQLLADPEVDLIICMGVLTTQEATQRGPFHKPVFAPFAVDASLPIYPRKGDASGVSNFNYLVTPSSIERDVALMKKMKPIKTVHMVVLDLFAQQIPNIQPFIESIFDSFQIKVHFVQGSQTAKGILEQLPQDCEMVYLTPLIRFTPQEKSILLDGLIQRRIPSFSLLGREEVDQGALAGLAPASDTVRWYRRLAINIQRTLRGENPGELPVLIKENSELVFNMETARKIGWYPNWDLQISAKLLNEEPEKINRSFSLEEAVRHAIKNNPELAAAESELASIKLQQKLAESLRKPQVESSLTGLMVDEKSSEASFGSQPERELEGEIKVSQVLFSESIQATEEIQGFQAQAAEQKVQAQRLDLVLQTAERYLNLLKAKTLYRVRRENLDLTNSHLDTAIVRRDVGIAGPSEVYRWESQLASEKLEAISARNQADQALYALNQILHETQEYQLKTTVPDLFDANMRSAFGRLQAYVTNTHDFALFRYFMVEEALRDAPEIKQIDSLIQLQKRKVLQDERAYYLPTIALQGAYRYQFHASETDQPLATLLPPESDFELPVAPDSGWNVALNFSLPIFQGGQRKTNLRMDRFQLEKLEFQKESLKQNLELRIRSGLQALATATVGIQLRQDAASSAKKNFELVEDAYAKGVASLIDLLDAQNAALISQLAEANAIYDYFIALMRFQRAAGNFDFFISEHEQEAFYQRLEAFYETHR